MDSHSLVDLIERLAPDAGVTQTPWPGLKVARCTAPMVRTPVVYSPSLCVVAQGRKRAYLGDCVFEYNPRNYLLCSLPLPIESEICDASVDAPMFAAVLVFDPAKVGKLLVEIDEEVAWPDEASGAAAVAPCDMTDGVHDALARFLAAVAKPLERRILGPGLERELIFEVLRGPNGNLLRNFVLRDGSAHRVAKIVSYLEKNFREPLEVAAMAKQAGMSSSTLHEHFKRATSMSPIQFVKKMRLHEARAQLIGGRGASEAAYDVGYTSPSQFSREFRRLFGQTPSQVAASV